MAQVALIWMVLLLQIAPVEQIASQARDAFLRGDFVAAADLFQLAADETPDQGVLAYNAALAAYEMGDEGRAMLYALRAQYLLPGDLDIQALLGLLRADSAETPPAFEDQLFALLEDLQGIIGVPALAVWYLGFAIMAWAMQRKLKPLMYSGLAMLTIALLLTASSALLNVRDSNHPAAVVMRSVPPMSGPGPDYLALTEFAAGTEVRIRDEDAGWLRVVSRSGRHGWLPQDALTRIGTN